MPQIAPPGRGGLARRLLKPGDDPRRIDGADVPAPGVARRPAKKSFVETWIGKLAVAAADMNPAVGDAERHHAAPCLSSDVVQASTLCAEDGRETPRQGGWPGQSGPS